LQTSLSAWPTLLNKAQVLLFGGRKRPPLGWQAGTYRARYRVTRGNENVLEKSFEASF
jgi:hypothetical protein